MIMDIKIINPGPLTTVQDSGRFGYMNSGFSSSGALDLRSMILANIIVGNKRDEAVLEMTLLGITAKFNTDNVIALTGADMNPKINDTPIPMYESVKILKGDILSLGFAKTGCRSYIAFSGGLNIEPFMGSKSVNLKCNVGGGFGRKLLANDELKLIAPHKAFLQNKIDADTFTDKVELRVTLGPQADYFTKKGIKTLLSSDYKVTNQSDRMGCRLEGDFIEYKETVDIISDGIPLGAIQITSGGKPIIMLADRQTTGGYAKIATVISVDIPKLVQCKAGCTVFFTAISVKKAQKLYKKEEKYYIKVESSLK